MNCSENFAIPHLGSSFDGHISCLQGSWKPFNTIPDCVGKIIKPNREIMALFSLQIVGLHVHASF